MEEKESDFKEKVKNSFFKAREDISELKNEIKELKEIILKQNEQISQINDKSMQNAADSLKKALFDDQLREASSGNEGVVTNKLTNKHITNTQQTQGIDELKEMFRSIGRQKVLLYLTIFKLEDEKTPVTHANLGKSLGLSEDSIRVYMFRMVQKGIPIDRIRVNNKLILFKIPQIIRAYNLKPFLEDLYYGTDGTQSRLTDL